MSGVEALKSSIRVCMFDGDGTVVDMQGGLRDVAAGFLAAKGWDGDPDRFVTWWRRAHFENSMIDALLQREHTPYREIGHLSVRQVMHRAGIAHTEADVRFLVAAIERLRAFRRSLKRLIGFGSGIGWRCCRMGIRTCWRRRNRTTAFGSMR